MKTNWGSIIKNVGGAVLSTVVPGGGMIVETINALLPDNKKLAADATGSQVQTAIDSLPPDHRAQIMSKEMDVEIAEINAWSSIQDSLARADASGASTRPFIAKLMAWAVFLTIFAFVLSWAVAIGQGEDTTLEQLADSWEIMLAILATPTALLRAYFGMRTKEKQARYGAAAGQPATVNPIMSLVQAFRGKQG